MRKQKSFVTLDTICSDMVKHGGLWTIILEVTNIDISMKSDDEKEMIMHVLQQVLNSFNTHVQFTYRRKKLDFSGHIMGIKSNLLLQKNEKLIEYGEGYVNFLNEISKGKLEVESYISIKADRKYSESDARSILTGVRNQMTRALAEIGIAVTQLKDLELKNILRLPEFFKEEIDYVILGSEYKRTYAILDYPREGYPNWLSPLLQFPHQIQLTQHLHPIPRQTISKGLELSIAKMQSTVDMQEDSGYASSAELKVRIDDAKDLLNRLVSGRDRIIEVSFYVTATANDLESLDRICFELEGAFRQIEVVYRKTRKQSAAALRSVLPICNDEIMEDYPIDTKSLATLVPFTARAFSNGGIFYGITEDEEIISMDRFMMANPNKIVLGNPGYGKSMLVKMEVPRQIINGAQAIIIDHNYEYKNFCEVLGGQYVEEGDTPDWNKHLLVFSGENKEKALELIWNHIQTTPIRKRLLIIEEFHNVLRQNKMLVLTVIQEIRKYFTAPTLITQNIVEFLMSDEGKMIMDMCSIKIFMRQGEAAVEEIAKLFDLSKKEKMYLKTSMAGHGYIITESYKTRFHAKCSDAEYKVITTRPQDRVI